MTVESREVLNPRSLDPSGLEDTREYSRRSISERSSSEQACDVDPDAVEEPVEIQNDSCLLNRPVTLSLRIPAIAFVLSEGGFRRSTGFFQ
jgi:hypothetical protein